MGQKICRMCKSSQLKKFLDLGFTALSDNFLKKEQLEEPEMFFPLTVYSCQNCGLSQLGYVVSPELMFNENYPYDSSTTKMGRDHFTNMGINICDRFELKPDSFVMDVGSNAGVLLSGFKSKGMRVLGIEPSSNIAKIAINNGIDTFIDFFSNHLKNKIIEKYGYASVITGTNVFAHIDDLDDFMKTCDSILLDDGILVIEAPYLLNLIENLEYDTIYHEHLSYISVKPMIQFCNRFDFDLFDVEEHKIHGGTLRYFIGRKNRQKISENVSKFIKLENEKQLYSEIKLQSFSKSVETHRSDLQQLLYDLKKNGKKIVAISAPAKGNTLLNYCKIGPELLDFVTERNPLKINTYTPGMHIPVFSDAELLEKRPDYALILAWNFSDEIIKNNSEFQRNGGKFIIPIPKPLII